MGFLLEVLAAIFIPVWLIASVGKMVPPLGRFFRQFSGAMFVLCLGLAWYSFAYGPDRKMFSMFPLTLGVAFLFYGSVFKK